MNVVNDNSCTWINDLNKRPNINILSEDKPCKRVIVGADYVGFVCS